VQTGDRLLARAAALLEPRAPGAPEIDDGLALERMAALLASNLGMAIYRAALIVTQELGLAGPMVSERSVAQRLVSKYRRAQALADG
jgi:hypothetical protein